jgi:ClpP class serine protease
LGRISVHLANEVIEEHLDDHLDQLEQEFAADVLSFVGPILFGADDAIRETVERRAPKRKKLSVVLETTGGYIEVVQRIVDTLRRHYETVDFVVPNYAMSAGTVLVMSGDAIHMDYYSVLGPIDPQVQRPGSDGMIPALGYLIQYERLIRKSSKSKLTTAELAFLVEKFDPAELYRYEQARELSISLLKEWLVKYKFKNWTKTETRGKAVTKQMRTRRASKIAATLNDTERWHVHGRGISMEVLRRELELKIDDFGLKPEFDRKLKGYYRLLVDYMTKLGHPSAVHGKGLFVPVLWR